MHGYSLTFGAAGSAAKIRPYCTTYSDISQHIAETTALDHDIAG